MSEAPLWSSILFMVAGIVVFIVGLGALKRTKATKNWPTTEGEVISTGVVHRRTSRPSPGGGSHRTYGAEVLFEYWVAGIRYSSDTIADKPYSESVFTRRQSVQAIANRYPPGKRVVVHYDPDKPDVAVLEPRFEKGACFPLFGGLLFFVLGLLMALGVF